MAGDLAKITVPCDSLAPVRVRRQLAALPALGWPLGDVMLIASELVTNAIRHSMCTEQDSLLVSVSRQPDHVRIGVRDPGRSGGTARIPEGGQVSGGLGLKIVEQLAVHWGSTRHPESYEVWAELPLVDATRASGRENAPNDDRTTTAPLPSAPSAVTSRELPR